MRVRHEVFDTYWQTAVERQSIFFNKINYVWPLTNNPIYSSYKFCNVYRASDRVSQFLIRNVIYIGKNTAEDLLFRILFFRLLNKSETWSELERILGEISLKNFKFERYSKALENIKESQNTIYGNAFILCATKAFDYEKKHQNHLALIEHIFKTSIYSEILKSRTLKELFQNLKNLPLLGNFMAYQMAIDLNYSPIFNFSENDFTIAGPGAIRGIKKCFVDTNGKSTEYIIHYMVENQDKEFNRLGLNFKNLWGRPMHAIDCQGWFCETDKYCRVKFPTLKSNRVKIKSSYKPTGKKIDYFYPPKWHLNLHSHPKYPNLNQDDK